MQKIVGILLVSVVFLSSTIHAATEKPTIQRQKFRTTKISSEIKIDGVLNEANWKNAQPLPLSYETNPGNNIPPQVRSECFILYDENYLYAACHAYDPNPDLIRAHFTDRDSAFQDDFMGIVIDTFHDQRRAFEFFVNPFGVQMDLFNDDVAQNEDSTWDAIWDSAGKITSDGFIVEMRIPFRSLRFPSIHSEQIWGLDIVRIYPRDKRFRIGLNRLDRNISCYLCQFADISGFQGITPGRNLEFDPTFTSHFDEERETFPDGNFHGDWTNDPGLSLSWGITPNWTVNTAINPDFSQVEADAAQLDINTQFALFFPEKRPFFLEGADFFVTPLQAVFTRNVADPIVGLKLTGKSGKNVAASFFSQDELTNILIPGSERSHTTSLDQNTSDTVLRYRRDIGKNSAFGLLATDREAQDYFNRVLGADGTLRFSDVDILRAQVVGSQTQYPGEISLEFTQPTGSFSDYAIHLGYTHDSQHWLWYGRYQDLGTDFRADMGFLPQVDIRLGIGGVGYTWRGESNNWYTRFFLNPEFQETTDQDGNLIERQYNFDIEYNGPLQSYVQILPVTRKRVFNGVSFDQQYVKTHFELTPTGSFIFVFDGRFGDELDFENTRNGQVVFLNPLVIYRFGKHLLAEVNHTFENLDEGSANLFKANLTDLKVVYQLNIRTFIRVISQYTTIDRNVDLYIAPTQPKTKEWFNQVLFSYKINPQTVLFLGYSDNHSGEEGIDLTQRDRTVFFKVGYALRL